MIFRYPDYYEKFSCIAGACEDTCCAGWEIDIDDKSYEYYKTVGGAFGEMLRQNIKEYENDEEDAYESHGFILKEGRRCPFLNENQLCVIYQNWESKLFVTSVRIHHGTFWNMAGQEN